jgi:uncharacterized membrane protein YphA (DoxX/SURF4 family)
MNKATRLYIVDALLAVSFLLAGVTGIMKMPGWFNFANSWNLPLMRIHDWSGIAMAVLVGIHLAMHWKWIVAMTKRLIIQNEKVRNIFIIVFAMVITAVLALSAYSLTSNLKKSQIEESSQLTQTETVEAIKEIQTGGCPFGIVDDPYPGRCGLYKDENNNAECDYGE